MAISTLVLKDLMIKSQSTTSVFRFKPVNENYLLAAVTKMSPHGVEIILDLVIFKLNKQCFYFIRPFTMLVNQRLVKGTFPDI